MTEFASRWPDVRLWAITRIKATVTNSGASAERQTTKTRQVVVSVVPQQMETAVSRLFFVNLEAWDSASKEDAYALVGEAAFQIESSPRNNNPVVKAELNVGPNENRDNDSGEYSYSATVVVTIHRL